MISVCHFQLLVVLVPDSTPGKKKKKELKIRLFLVIILQICEIRILSLLGSLITNSNSPVPFFFLMVLFPGLSPFWEVESMLFPRDGGSWGSRQAEGHGGNSWIPVYPRLQGTHWPAPASLVLSSQCCTQFELRNKYCEWIKAVKALLPVIEIYFHSSVPLWFWSVFQ